jgi:glucose/arabinose dehydrogenase
MMMHRLCKWTGMVSVWALVFVGCGARAAESLSTKRVASGLTSPVSVTHAPGDATRLFIVQQNGVIRILDLTQDPPVLLVTPFLNISSRVRTGGERGLLGLAFHPDYENNGYFYVNYTGFSGPTGDTFVARYHVPPATPNQADFNSEFILFQIAQPQSNHNGGWIAFGPNDGYLYIAAGDGGGAGDPLNYGQNVTVLLGKMLRIDVDGDDFPGDPNNNYAIPSDNPLVGEAGRDEIWAWGLRNPWRNAFDRETGDLYIADVGQGAREEVNFQPASSPGGENYGWRCREGSLTFSTAFPCDTLPPESFVDPVHEYAHGSPTFHCSISGGEVYRGCAVPNLHGTYFFADYCSNRIWSFRLSGDPPVVSEFSDRTTELAPASPLNITSITSFGLDAEGEMYICDHSGGEVFKIVPVNPPVPCSECGDNLREGFEECDGTDDAACPGTCLEDCTCPYVTPSAEMGDDTCFDGGQDTGAPCSTSDDCQVGEVCGNKSRYIAVSPPVPAIAGDLPRAIKVTIADLPLDPLRVGEEWWAQAHHPIPNTPLPSVTGASLECTDVPVLQSYPSEPIHLYGAPIVPGSTYEVRMCDDVETCSDPIMVSTGSWGDVVAPFGGASQPNFGDVSAVVDKFRGLASAPDITRSDLIGVGGQGGPNVPDQIVNFSDVSGVVDAFRASGFPYAVPPCP